MVRERGFQDTFTGSACELLQHICRMGHLKRTGSGLEARLWALLAGGWSKWHGRDIITQGKAWCGMWILGCPPTMPHRDQVFIGDPGAPFDPSNRTTVFTGPLSVSCVETHCSGLAFSLQQGTRQRSQEDGIAYQCWWPAYSSNIILFKTIISQGSLTIVCINCICITCSLQIRAIYAYDLEIAHWITAHVSHFCFLAFIKSLYYCL